MEFKLLAMPMVAVMLSPCLKATPTKENIHDQQINASREDSSENPLKHLQKVHDLGSVFEEVSLNDPLYKSFD